MTSIVSAMRIEFINGKALRTELAKKTHGDIVELLNEKMERMFKFKTMCSAAPNGGDHTKLDFTSYKRTNSFPEWWTAKWTDCLVDGTVQYGWCNVPAQFAREQHSFTKEWKGPKKTKKASKKDIEERKRLEAVQKAMCNVQIDGDGQSASNGGGTPSATVSGTATPLIAVAAEPVLVVRLRQWVEEGPKQ